MEHVCHVSNFIIRGATFSELAPDLTLTHIRCTGVMRLTHSNLGPVTQTPSSSRRAFTLLEALIACVILLMAVMACTMAIHAGRQYSLFGQDQVNATLAADALLSEILAAPYADIPGYDDLEDTPGSLATPAGVAYPTTYNRIGRRAQVASATQSIPNIGVIQGYDVLVVGFNVDGEILCTLKRFVPAS